MKRLLIYLVMAFLLMHLVALVIIAHTWHGIPGGYVKNRLGLSGDKLALAKRLHGELIERHGNQKPQVVKLVIEKAKHELSLLCDDKVWFRCDCGLGQVPTGHKDREGDFRTPEGQYYVCTRNEKSKYYLFLGLSYPGPDDAERGLQLGLINQDEHDQIKEAAVARKRPPWNTELGGMVGIHGSGNALDWTRGCIALDDNDMATIWQFCSLGTPVTIKP